MNLVVPWTELLSLIAQYAPRAKTGRPPFELATMLRIHFLQQWFGLSDLVMVEALFETALYREFAAVARVAGMSAPAVCQGTPYKREMPVLETRNAPNSSLCRISRLSTQRQPCFEHHP